MNIEGMHVSEAAKMLVEILNAPEEYVGEFDWVDRNVDRNSTVPMNDRIRAKTEYDDKNEEWRVYIEWDDMEPNTAKFLVHKAVKEFGFTEFHSCGTTGKWETDGSGGLARDDDGEKIPKFGRENALPAYLRVSRPE